MIRKLKHARSYSSAGLSRKRETGNESLPPQRQLDFPTVDQIVLNLNCRDEIIPVLRSLQYVYQNTALRHDLLDLIGKDVNGTASHKLGRRGLDYWSITVLASVRLGCNLDYDKLQDLAEQHRNLRFDDGPWRLA